MQNIKSSTFIQSLPIEQLTELKTKGMGSLSITETSVIIAIDCPTTIMGHKSKVIRRKKKTPAHSSVHLQPLIQFEIIPSLHCIPLGNNETMKHQPKELTKELSYRHYDYDCDEYDEFDDCHPTLVKGGRVTSSNKKTKLKKDRLINLHDETKERKKIDRIKENQLNQKLNVENVLLKKGIRRTGTTTSLIKPITHRNTIRCPCARLARVDPPTVTVHELKKNNIPKEHEFLRLLVDLQHRELTPEDYELLLLLEDTVAAKTVDATLIESIKDITPLELEQIVGDVCSICMECFGRDQAVKMLPNCRHYFHSKCIDNWLSNSSMKCPLDGLEVFPE